VSKSKRVSERTRGGGPSFSGLRAKLPCFVHTFTLVLVKKRPHAEALYRKTRVAFSTTRIFQREELVL
jgi:hypothetical protein